MSSLSNAVPVRALIPASVSQIHQIADRLAWQNDSPANDLASYPGPGWQADEPLPTWDAPTFDPDAYANAWSNGFARGRDLELGALPPGDTPAHLRLSWFSGFSEGLTSARTATPEAYFTEILRVEDVRAFHRDMTAWLDRIDREDRERMQEEVEGADTIHPDETIRALGIHALRSII